MEIAICATDLAEVIGSAVALKLLFGLPLVAGVCITAVDVLVFLFMNGTNFYFCAVFMLNSNLSLNSSLTFLHA